MAKRLTLSHTAMRIWNAGTWVIQHNKLGYTWESLKGW